MKILSVLALSTACSLSLGFLAKVQPTFAATLTATKDGQLSSGKVDYLTFSGLEPGKLFDVQVNSNTVDPLLGLLNDSGILQVLNDDKSDNSVLSELTGIVPTSGSLNLAVTGSGDTNLAGQHFASGSYTVSLKTFDLPTPPTKANLINSGFEGGDFTGWTILGENSIETAKFGSGPSQGNYQALLSTGGGSFANSILEQFLGVNAGSLDSLLPPPSPILPPPLQSSKGSAIQQTFTAKAGDIVSFDWNFLTNELPPNLGLLLPDFSFVSISSPVKSILSELADATTFSLLGLSQSTGFLQETGFQSFSFQIPTDGIYKLGVGVTNKFDNFTDSAVLVDNFQITSVPEPTSVLGILGFGAFLGAGSVLKRKQQ
jgi:hypothetical protein